MRHGPLKGHAAGLLLLINCERGKGANFGRSGFSSNAATRFQLQSARGDIGSDVRRHNMSPGNITSLGIYSLGPVPWFGPKGASFRTAGVSCAQVRKKTTTSGAWKTIHSVFKGVYDTGTLQYFRQHCPLDLSNHDCIYSAPLHHRVVRTLIKKRQELG